MKTLLIVNPRATFPTYYGLEFVTAETGTRLTGVADLASVTVAALATPHFEVRVTDEMLDDLDLSVRPDWVALTGKQNQAYRMIELARYFRAHGCKVVMGGPFASLSSETLRPHCDVLVEGELEAIADELFSDLARGTARPSYKGGRPPLDGSPIPRWELYPNERALMGCVQTSRGCPFLCEFCDVIQYLGRSQRFKPIGNILRELDVLYRSGYRRVFLADDNLTVNRSRCKELLQAISDWNDCQPERISFVTQGSIDAARDEELLRMCARAGLQNVFVGVETPHQESLKETKKTQNAGFDLADRLTRYVEHAISLDCGCMLGFDADGPDIVEVHREFWARTPIPKIVVNNLNAVESTPLYDRMKRDGRLFEDSMDSIRPWTGNIQPLHITREEQAERVRATFAVLYAPEAFGDRLERFCEAFGRSFDPDFAPPRIGRPTESQKLSLKALNMMRRSPEHGALWKRVQSLSNRYPRVANTLGPTLVLYLQAHYIFNTAPVAPLAV